MNKLGCFEATKRTSQRTTETTSPKRGGTNKKNRRRNDNEMPPGWTLIIHGGRRHSALLRRFPGPWGTWMDHVSRAPAEPTYFNENGDCMKVNQTRFDRDE